MKIKTSVLFVLSAFLLLLFSPGESMDMNKDKQNKEKKALLQLETKLSSLCKEKGLLAALYPLTTDYSLLLPLSGHPILGKKNCEKLLSLPGWTGPEGKIQWEPQQAGVSAAGDLGYTYGSCRYPGKEKGKMVADLYCNIWRKDNTGQWKLAVCRGLVRLQNLNQSYPGTLVHRDKADAVTRAVMDTELAFAKYAADHKNIPAAFFHFMDEKGFAISETSMVTKGQYARAAQDMEEKIKSGEKMPALEWKPIFSFAAKSKDMAYNYGPYVYTLVGANGKPQKFYGYFVTVWKKQADGSWKFLYDGGNQSPEHR